MKGAPKCNSGRLYCLTSIAWLSLFFARVEFIREWVELFEKRVELFRIRVELFGERVELFRIRVELCTLYPNEKKNLAKSAVI